MSPRRTAAIAIQSVARGWLTRREYSATLALCQLAGGCCDLFPRAESDLHLESDGPHIDVFEYYDETDGGVQGKPLDVASTPEAESRF